VAATTLDELPGWARTLLERGRVARLGLLDDAERPRVMPVTYAIHDGAIWSAVDRKPKRPGEPARVRYLRRRSDAALTVDRYSDDWKELCWVQALGHVEIVAIETAPGALAALAAKYEPYREQPPPGPLLRFVPERLICWRAAG
jgi:PPOX class probable F420-dependent enzyme